MHKIKKPYNNNDDMKEIINFLLYSNGIKKGYISSKMGITSTNFSGLLNKKNINLNDLKRICDIVGYDIEINLIPKDHSKQNQETE